MPGNDVEIKITADTSGAEAGVGKVKSGFQGMKDSLVKNQRAIGIGITALGVGMEALAQKQAPLTEQTRKLGNATGMSEESIRGMATSLSNATFPLESALELMTQGATQGLESADALKEYATFWDMVGDATGLGAEELAKSGAALKSVGIAAGSEKELLGAFGLITRETSGDVGEFLKFIERLAPEMGEMGLSVDDAAVAMAAMESQGLTSRAAMQEFRGAIAELSSEQEALGGVIGDASDDLADLADKYNDGKISEEEFAKGTAEANKTIQAAEKALEKLKAGGLAPILDQLGLNSEKTAEYRDRLQELDVVMGEDADALASTKTAMDRLKSSMSDLIFENGALVEKASMLAPIFMAAGPIVAGFSGIMGILTPVLHGAKLAFIGLNLSMGVVTLAVLGIAAAIALGIVIWKNFDTIIQFFKDSWSKLVSALPLILGPIGLIVLAVVKLGEHWDEIWNAIIATWDIVSEALITGFTTVRDTMINTLKVSLDILKTTWEIVFKFIKDTVKKVFDKITEIYHSKLGWLLPAGPLIKAILFIKKNWDEVWESVKSTFTTVTTFLVTTFETVKGKILGIWTGISDGIKASVNVIIKVINGFINGINKLEIKFPSWDPIIVAGKTVIPGFAGMSLGFPNIRPIPELAAGGIVSRPTLAMLGEQGPEAVVPLGRGGMGITVNITIAGDVLGMDDFEQKVTSVVRDAVLGGGFQGVLARA